MTRIDKPMTTRTRSFHDVVSWCIPVLGMVVLPPLSAPAQEGELRTQCQLQKMEGGMPDLSQGDRRCPPDCAGNLASRQSPDAITRPGKLPPPPKASE